MRNDEQYNHGVAAARRDRANGRRLTRANLDHLIYCARVYPYARGYLVELKKNGTAGMTFTGSCCRARLALADVEP